MQPQNNPRLANPPDYLTERYAPARQRIEAAQHLLDLWHTQNAIEQQDWDAQQELNAEQQHLALENRQREEEDAQRAKLQEEEEARKEERKKNHSKFLPFADVLPSLTIPITPSPLTLRKLRKGEYIPFYFFTNKGLADAQSISQSTDEDALAFMPDEQGIHSLIPIASAKAKKSIVQDQDLTWAQLDEATHCILQAMKEADWPQDCLNAMLQFWMNLGTDEWPHDADETARQVLIIYQAMYQCRWHDTLGTNSSFNPRHINQEALIRIKAKLIDQHYQITEKRAKEASTFPLSYPPKSVPPKHTLSLSADAAAQSQHKRLRSFRLPEKPTVENKTLPPCAVCLGIDPHEHPIVECIKDHTWDGKHETFSKRVNHTLVAKFTNQRLCSRWQCEESCTDSHPQAHLCSGCGSATHGAFLCPRVQKRPSANSL
ncbi:hypothetical protein V8E55_007863 [Tylopilus felleus]